MTTNEPQRSVDQLAGGALDIMDDLILSQLSAFYDTLDPVPSGLVDRIQFGITLDALHAELASLQRMEAELLGARGEAATGVQTVTFTSASMTTMVTITPTDSGRVRIDGWIAPGAGVSVELRIVGESRTTVADDDGRFVIEDVPHGLGQFLLRPETGSALPVVITPSMEL